MTATATYDNPLHRTRDVYVGGKHLIRAYREDIERIIDTPQYFCIEEYRGLNVGPWTGGYLHGDAFALPSSMRPRGRLLMRALKDPERLHVRIDQGGGSHGIEHTYSGRIPLLVVLRDATETFTRLVLRQGLP
ncbi:MAG: hypothetical protein V4607_02120 [Pseudomonadota bacterium]